MRISKERLENLLFAIFISSPLGTMMVIIYGHIFGFLGWQPVVIGMLVLISVASMVILYQRENRIRSPGFIAALQRDIGLLLGTWRVAFARGNPSDWTFRGDGVVTSTQGATTGTWKVKDNIIWIRWNHPTAWETLQRPINPSGTPGESWMPEISPIFATKIDGSK